MIPNENYKSFHLDITKLVNGQLTRAQVGLQFTLTGMCDGKVSLFLVLTAVRLLLVQRFLVCRFLVDQFQVKLARKSKSEALFSSELRLDTLSLDFVVPELVLVAQGIEQRISGRSLIFFQPSPNHS